MFTPQAWIYGQSLQRSGRDLKGLGAKHDLEGILRLVLSSKSASPTLRASRTSW
jgi:hypothetical protein